MARNLAEIIPAVITGPGGVMLTPEQIAQRQAMAQSLIGRATDTRPDTGGWASVLNKALMGGLAGYDMRQADLAETANADWNRSEGSVLGALLAGVDSPVAASAATSGVNQELVASSPSTASGLVDVSKNGDTFEPFIGTVRGAITNPYGLAAVAATGKAESGWSGGNANRTWSDPSESGQAGTAGGILSWRGPRLAALQAYAKGKGEAGNGSPQTQAEFFLREDPSLIAKLNNAKSIEEAQSVINRAWAFAGYDRPGGEAGRRLQYARSYLPQLQGTTQVAASSPASAAIEQAAPTSGYIDPVVSAPNSAPQAGFDADRFGEPAQVASILAGGTPEIYSAQSDFAPPLPEPVNVASAPAVASVPAAPAAPDAPSASREAITRALQVMNDPRATPGTRAVAQALLQREQGRQEQAQKLALAEQQRQAEIARRQAIAQQTGINPSYASDDELWKGAAAQIFQDAPTATVNGVVVNTRTGQPVYQAPADPQTYTGYAEYERSQGRTPLGPLEYEQALRRSGAAQTNIDTGTIPTGYRAVRDEQGRVVQYEPIPGGPAATEAATLQRTTERQADQRATASRVITDAATRALEAMKAPGLPATGVIGAAASWLPESNAAEVRRQVEVLKSSAKIENLNAMRAASPTGGALGAVSDKESDMLAAKSGTLDPNSPNFERDLKDYTLTQLEIIHGVKAGREIFNSLPMARGSEADDAPPEGVDPEDWKYMSPEDRALFK